MLDPGGPRKSDVLFVVGKNKQKYESFEFFLPGVGLVVGLVVPYS